MKTRILILSALLAPVALSAQSSSSPKPSTIGASTTQQESSPLAKAPTQEQVQQLIVRWKEAPRKAAQEMISKYGAPQEATANRLIWLKNDPWKRTEIINEEIRHDFPKQHGDVLEQTVAYKVPAEKFTELAKFDGSVMAERTRGELSARCDREGMNILALNLAHDIITGKSTADQARTQFTQIAQQVEKGEKHAYTTSLQFKPVTVAEATDPGQTTVGSAAE